MRWTLIGLLTLNIGYVIWNWLQFSHQHKNFGVVSADYATGNKDSEMPGIKLKLLESSVSETELMPAAENSVVNNTEIVLANKVVVEKPIEPICALVGPFADVTKGKLFIEKFLSMNIKSQLKGLQQDGEVDYWVYIKPEITRELALAKLKELQDRKIDSFVIPEGQIVNGISLGVFDNPANAEKQKIAIEKMGYIVEIMPNRRKYVENWIVIASEDQEKLNGELLKMVNSESLSVVIKKEACSKVASWSDIQ